MMSNSLIYQKATNTNIYNEAKKLVLLAAKQLLIISTM